MGSRPALAALCFAVSLWVPAHAQSYPDRVVKFIVPFSPGGVTDVVARPVAQRLAVMWGQQTIVENRPGAGSTIGAEAVARARPDGYTLLFSGNTHAVAAALYKRIPFDAVGDFTPVALVAEQPSVLVVHPSVPAKSTAELITLAAAQPGKLNYASSGNGSSQHLFAALFLAMAGVQMTHVPYKGSGPALAELLSGQVPVSVPSISNALSHIQAGKLRALAVTSSKRAASLPDVPTLDEAGVRGYDAALWFCVLGPKGLPADVVTKLYESIAEALRSPEVQTAYATQGIDARLMPPGPFADYLRAEAVKWARIVKESGATVD